MLVMAMVLVPVILIHTLPGHGRQGQRQGNGGDKQ